jgi:hypothetical protein
LPDHAGTVERVGLELSAALGRVPQALGPDQVLETFTRFGVEFPPQLLAHAGFETARGASVQAAADLRTATNELLNAVSGGDAVQIVAKGAQLTAANAAVAGTFGGLSTQLQAAAPSLPGVTAAQVATLTADFPRKLFDFLVVEQLDIVPAVGATMTFLGLVDRAYHAADPAHPTSAAHEVASLRLDRLGPLLTNPAQHFSDLYGWGTGTFDGHLLFPAIRDLVARMGLPAAYDGGSAPSVQAFALDLKTAAGSTPGIATEVLLPIGGGIDHPLAVPHPAWSGHLKATATLAAATSGTVRPPLAITLRPPSGEISGEAELRLEAKPADPFVLIGAAGSSRLEVGELAAALGFDITWNSAAGEATLDPFARAELKHGKLVIDTSSGDGFVSHLLSGAGRIEAGFQVGATWSATRGVQFVGSSTLEIALPIHVTIGPIELPALYLVLGVQGGGFSLELSGDIKALLGPLTAIVHRLGAVAHLTFPAGGGNMGPAQLGFGFKPPSGVGLRVDAGPITGGGFLAFDEPKGEYFGALELSFEGLFSLKAVGIVTTKLPNGGDGFALLILVTAEFVPVQLGFGFTLLGVGGLLGVNRTVSTDALRQGVRSGSIESVLFPPDVVGNITQIVSDLKSFFPIADGHFVVAPMGKLGWGTPTLISLELGVVIDIPSPQLTILGVLRCLLPEEDAPLLALQVNFAGGIDFDRGLIWFDASLFDSRLLVYTLSGDMALRIGWGDEPVFVVSVGGFHPAFKEVPSDLTGMKRLTIALMSGNNPRLVAESYFAVTSNTVQSGAKVELYAAAGSFNVHGYLGYDLLVQFDPFHFVADLYAGLALRWGDDVICSLDVSCELSGPAPWHAKGHASLKLTPLGPRVSIGFDETWGDDAPALPQQTEDVLAKIATAVGDDRSWQATLPANTSQTVSLRAVDQDGDMVLLHPFGVLSVSQKVAPLDFQIDRFGNKKPVGDTKYEMTHAGGGTEDLREEFAVANFITLNDSQKLSRKSFEKLKSGLRFGVADGSATGATVHKDVNYEFRYVHRKRMTSKRIVGLLKELFDIMVHGGAVTRNALSVANRRPGGNGPAPVEIPDGAYHVVSVIDLLPHGAGAAVHTQAEAYALQDELVGADPALAGTLQVVAAHELAEAA